MDGEFLLPELAGLDLEHFMREALALADAAGRAGEYPIGAVIVIDGQIVSRGRARHAEFRSQVRHAEMNAIWEGGEALWQHFERAVLFTTLEPCPMCLGAAVMADIPHIVFAARDGVVQSRLTVQQNPYVRRHIRSYHGGVLETEARAIIGQYDAKMLNYISGQRSS